MDVVADRTLLLNVAYRILGSVTEAEDAVQEAHARWYAMPGDAQAAVVSVTGWMVTTVSRICLDVLKSARSRRERYVGPWLPEPLPGSVGWVSGDGGIAPDPADAVTLDESLTTAMLVVLEEMTPAERVAFVLHDVFQVPYAQIGQVVGRRPEACRQLASSARRRVRARRPVPVASPHQSEVVAALLVAWRAADVPALLAVLDPDATVVVDSGGLVDAAVETADGADEVARILVEVGRRQPELTLRSTVINGAPGIVATDATGTTLAVVSPAVLRGRITHLWIVRNPEKLTGW